MQARERAELAALQAQYDAQVAEITARAEAAEVDMCRALQQQQAAEKALRFVGQSRKKSICKIAHSPIFAQRRAAEQAAIGAAACCAFAT